MNPVLAAIPGSAIRAINAMKRPGDIDLGLGEPRLKPAIAWFEAATAWVATHGCPYSANAGEPALREAIARTYAYPGLGEARHVCVTVGSQEALYLALSATLDPATDEVLIVTPAYPAYSKLCQLLGLRHHEVGLDPATGFAPDAARVLTALTPATRLLLLASPANPTGRVWPRSELEKLAAGLLARPGAPVTVLLDEVYRALDYTAAPSLASLYPHVLVANSLSKSHALTGLRLGWLLGDAAKIAGVVKAHQFLATAASTYSQQVALAAFADPAGLNSHHAHYAGLRTQLLANLQAAKLDYIPPDGAFYCLVKLPEHLAADSLQAATALLESTRVVTIPGAAFGAEGWLRLSWVVDATEMSEGIRRLARFFETC